MKIIVDTNIIIRSLINPGNKFGEILLNPKPGVEFIAPAYLREEYYNHREKVLSFTKYNFNEFRELEFCIFDTIHFVSEKLLPLEITATSMSLVADIDKKDFAFVAFAIWMDAKLWTIDDALRKGLLSKSFDRLIDTDEVMEKYSNA